MRVISEPLNQIHGKIKQNHFLVKLSASDLMTERSDLESDSRMISD